jgi:hypothetical protein
MEDERFSLHDIAYDNVFVAGRKSTLHPIYCNFICHPVVLVGEALMNPIMVVVWLFKQMFSSNIIEKNLSKYSYFIILTCDAKSASRSTTIRYELVFKKRSRNLDFMVQSTMLWPKWNCHHDHDNHHYYSWSRSSLMCLLMVLVSHRASYCYWG